MPAVLELLTVCHAGGVSLWNVFKKASLRSSANHRSVSVRNQRGLYLYLNLCSKGRGDYVIWVLRDMRDLRSFHLMYQCHIGARVIGPLASGERDARNRRTVIPGLIHWLHFTVEGRSSASPPVAEGRWREGRHGRRRPAAG